MNLTFIKFQKTVSSCRCIINPVKYGNETFGKNTAQIYRRQSFLQNGACHCRPYYDSKRHYKLRKPFGQHHDRADRYGTNVGRSHCKSTAFCLQSLPVRRRIRRRYFYRAVFWAEESGGHPPDGPF